MFSSEPTFEFLTFDLVFVETWEKKKRSHFYLHDVGNDCQHWATSTGRWPLTSLIPADEGDVCPEQRFMSDRRWPAEPHSSAWRPLLESVAAASPAHREGKDLWPLTSLTPSCVQKMQWLSLVWVVSNICFLITNCYSRRHGFVL